MEITRKQKIAVVVIAVLAVASIVAVYALSTLTFNQNPVVPADTGVNFTTTPTIEEGSDQTGLWSYTVGTKTFTATITLTNNRNSAWTPTVTASSVPSGWTFSCTPPTIAAYSSSTITFLLTYTTGSPASGAIGNFAITIA